ncbi:hypothetical protein [Paenibacillus hemerocallicola]|uniref:hypothetical protein n=1 Tax=Paenibacillus hemerocallicola TaxID=1172614 RepID=UPI00159EF2CE|nr:hypothetical protein [Paenibacillus hemerocallicola]
MSANYGLSFTAPKAIADTLNDRGIVISERYAQTLYERYQTLISASLDEHVNWRKRRRKMAGSSYP